MHFSQSIKARENYDKFIRNATKKGLKMRVK